MNNEIIRSIPTENHTDRYNFKIAIDPKIVAQFPKTVKIPLLHGSVYYYISEIIQNLRDSITDKQQ